MLELGPHQQKLDPIETASRDEIEALQLARLKWSLSHAYENVPYLKTAFAATGVHPDDLKTLTDIQHFPFTQKSALRETYPFGMFAVPRAQIARLHASSGTTGKPTVVGYTARDLETWAGLMDLRVEQWDAVMRTNLRGTFLNTQAAAKLMIAGGVRGSVVNLGSGCNKVAFPRLVDYTASKGGIEQFTKVAASELGPHGIRVNAIAPGWIATPLTQALQDDPTRSAAILGPAAALSPDQPAELRISTKRLSPVKPDSSSRSRRRPACRSLMTLVYSGLPFTLGARRTKLSRTASIKAWDWPLGTSA